MEILILLLVYGGFCFLVARLGRKRQIGFGWSLFFSIFLSPIVGFITTMLSPKYYDPNPEPSAGKRAFGWLLIVFFGLGAFGMLAAIGGGGAPEAAFNSLSLAIGLVGAGIYLIGRGQGKSYSTEVVPVAQ